MGVPLRRPAAALQADQFVPDVLDPAWLDVFRFCTVPDLGACLSVDRCWNSVADSPHVWAEAYDRTQRVDSTSSPSGEGLLRALIERPFGEDAVGWRVAVLVEDGTERVATGHILAYRVETDAYLVSYDPDEGQHPGETRECWEQERRRRTAAMRQNPSLAGKSRFSFLAPPACDWPSRMLQRAGCRSGPSRSPALRFRTWKQELENNVRNAPSRMLVRLDDHTDEVLFVVFSPCGSRLASCSRDLRTVIFRIRPAVSGGEGGLKSAHPKQSSAGSRPAPTFEREAVLLHQTAPCRAIWWPTAPYNLLAVSTEDAGWQGASKVEIWEVFADAGAATAPGPVADGLPIGIGARCLFQGQNRPFDIYAVVCPWPGGCGGGGGACPPASAAAPPQRPVARPRRRLAAGGAIATTATQAVDPESLCFLSGWAVFREHGRYVQWLNVWPGPHHPRFRAGLEPIGGGGGHNGGPPPGSAASPAMPAPLARLRLEGEMNYLHCLEVGPAPQGRRILAMTGSTPHLCNEIGLLDLTRLRSRRRAPDAAGAGRRRGEVPPFPAGGSDTEAEGDMAPTAETDEGTEASVPTFDVEVEVHSLGDRVVLSAKWSSRGDLLLLNTRPYAQSATQQIPCAGGAARGGSSASSAPSAGLAAGASFEDLLLRPAPDLSTSMELLLLDAQSFDVLGVFDGHFAFTTKESPFLIFTDEWADSDFLASGGEDHRVYVWHRRHRRLIRRLQGHTEPVNAVSWNSAGLLASASDDHSIIVWAVGGIGQPQEGGAAACGSRPAGL